MYIFYHLKVLSNSQVWLKITFLKKMMKSSTFSNNKLIKILKVSHIIKSNLIKSKITTIKKSYRTFLNTIISNHQTAKNIFKSKAKSFYKKWTYQIKNQSHNSIHHAKLKFNPEILLLWKILKSPKNKP